MFSVQYFKCFLHWVFVFFFLFFLGCCRCVLRLLLLCCLAWHKQLLHTPAATLELLDVDFRMRISMGESTVSAIEMIVFDHEVKFPGSNLK